MESPHEVQQKNLLSRIIVNVEKLNEVLEEVNDRMEELNNLNNDITMLSNIWSNFDRNVAFNLENIGAFDSPV
ncbi:hypothetical protein K7432_004279 [Basidiobolus ranarum]|uniref:DASH complex subunit DAD4 n=1 Tax=Basidiobolus ranarum TaxID=34480 RepID=A0ABR2WYL9_9FUNG